MEPDSESSMLDKGRDAPEAWPRKHAFEGGFFPAEQKPASHRMLGMECSCLKASSLHREPGLSWSGHPATPSKDGQCCHPVLLSTFPSSSAQHSSPFRTAQHISRALPHTPASTNHFFKQKGGWGSGHLLSRAASQQSTACLAPRSGNRALTPSPISPMDWTSPHSVASPSKGLDQSQPGECRAASLF